MYLDDCSNCIFRQCIFGLFLFSFLLSGTKGSMIATPAKFKEARASGKKFLAIGGGLVSGPPLLMISDWFGGGTLKLSEKRPRINL